MSPPRLTALAALALVGCAEGTVDRPLASHDDAAKGAEVLADADDESIAADDAAEPTPPDAGAPDAPKDGVPSTDLTLPSDAPRDAPAPLPDVAPPTPDRALPAAVCGDGVIDRMGGEACDDGNRVDGDTCAADCRQVLCAGGTRRVLDATTGRCYWRESEVVRRPVAVTRCEAAGAALAAFETEAERSLVYPPIGLGGSNRLWVGLQRVGATWRWDSGAELSYTGFRPGEPSGDGSCAEWGPADNFNDLGCDNARDFVCERPPAGRAP